MTAERDPALADKQRFRVDGRSGIIGVLHGFICGVAHHVPAHAVDFVFVEPVFHGVHHQLLGHLVVGRQIVAEAADEIAIGILERIIVRHDIIQEIGLGHMGVDHVQYDAHVRLVNGVNHRLQFFDAKLGIRWIFGVSTVRRNSCADHTPVVLIVFGRIIQLPVLHGRFVTVIPSHHASLNMGDAQGLDVFELLFECIVGSPSHVMQVVLNRRIGREIPDVNLPDDGVFPRS